MTKHIEIVKKPARKVRKLPEITGTDEKYFSFYLSNPILSKNAITFLSRALNGLSSVTAARPASKSSPEAWLVVMINQDSHGKPDRKLINVNQKGLENIVLVYS